MKTYRQKLLFESILEDLIQGGPYNPEPKNEYYFKEENLIFPIEEMKLIVDQDYKKDILLNYVTEEWYEKNTKEKKLDFEDASWTEPRELCYSFNIPEEDLFQEYQILVNNNLELNRKLVNHEKEYMLEYPKCDSNSQLKKIIDTHQKMFQKITSGYTLKCCSTCGLQTIILDYIPVNFFEGIPCPDDYLYQKGNKLENHMSQVLTGGLRCYICDIFRKVWDRSELDNKYQELEKLLKTQREFIFTQVNMPSCEDSIIGTLL